MRIHLRGLKEKDALLMMEWMHDINCVAHLEGHFQDKTLEDCKAFIKNSWDCKPNLHLAITDEQDNYLGTVSLKNIDLNAQKAEFAIALRSLAMGTGVAKDAMQRMIDKGFKELNLKKIYWYVSPQNARAIRFYDKNGYLRTKEIMEGITFQDPDKYVWFMVQEDGEKYKA